MVHVLSRLPEGWEGDEGRIEAVVLARHLPERYQRLQYFICGSDSMMYATEDALSPPRGTQEESSYRAVRYGLKSCVTLTQPSSRY